MSELLKIDNPQIRKALYDNSGVKKINGVTVPLLTEPGVLFGNYIRNPGESDDTADVLPTMLGLEALSYALSEKDGPNRLLVVARKRVKENLPLGHQAVEKAIIAAEKTDGQYAILENGIDRMITHLVENGVLWIAPGATTEKDGFKLDLHAGGIRFAKRANGHVYVAAMVTEDTPQTRIVREIHIQEIDIPDVTQFDEPSKQILQEAYTHIGRYVMAVAASLIPDTQERGDFAAYEMIMQQSCDSLRAMDDQGIFVSGGFLETR